MARFDAPRWHRAWAGRWERWWSQRHPRCDRIELTQRNVYILPTGAGWLFAALLLVLLLASINYQLNLGYLLTFGLAGVGLSSMHGTHANLRGLLLQAQAGDAVFAGEMAQLHITVSEAHASREPTSAAAPAGRRSSLTGWLARLLHAPRTRYGVGLRLQSLPQPARPASKPPADHDLAAARGAQETLAAPAWSWIDVPSGQEVHLLLGQQLPKRGWHPAQRVLVETRYPFGLFRAWTVWRPAAHWLAWPAPERPAAPLPWSAAGEGERPAPLPQATAQAGQETAGLRTWRRSDSLTQVHWKKTAQSLAGGGELISRDMQGPTQARLLLDWSDAACRDEEQRLARLCAWVLAAEQAGIAYTLQLPGQRQKAGIGAQQRRDALQLLATWGQPAMETPAAGPSGRPT